MPIRWLEAFIEMLPALRAERTLYQISAFNTGSPATSKADRRSKLKTIKDLQRLAEAGRPAAAPTEAELKYQPARLVGMGLSYKKVEGK